MVAHSTPQVENGAAVSGPLSAPPPSTEVPFYEYARQRLAGCSPDLELFPQPARLGPLGMHVAAEGPIALVDDTLRKNASRGLLLTPRALYFLEDGRRLPLEHVTTQLHFPRGEEEASVLVTPNGPFAIPSIHQRSTRQALLTMLDIITSWASGDRRMPLAELSARGPISAAAAQLVAASAHVTPGYAVRDGMRDTFRGLLRGMELDLGEEVLAIIDEDNDAEGVVITDRGLYSRSKTLEPPNAQLYVSFSSLLHVAPKSVLFGRGVALTTHAGVREVAFVNRKPAADALARFLYALLHLPPQLRSEPRRAAHDPNHAPGVDRALLDEFLGRLDLHRQTQRWTRAKREAWALSPLSLADLRAAMPYLLGAPLREHWDGRVLTLDFPFNAGSSGVGRAVASSAVGLALLATVGVGWVSTPSGPAFHHVRVRLCEMAGASGFRIGGLAASGDVEAPALLGPLETKLLTLEAEVMRRRCMLGLDLAFAPLLGADLN